MDKKRILLVPIWMLLPLLLFCSFCCCNNVSYTGYLSEQIVLPEVRTELLSALEKAKAIAATEHQHTNHFGPFDMFMQFIYHENKSHSVVVCIVVDYGPIPVSDVRRRANLIFDHLAVKIPEQEVVHLLLEGSDGTVVVTSQIIIH